MKNSDRKYSLMLAAGAILAFSSQFSLAADAQSYLDQARASIVRGELNAGVIQLKNALQKDPENAQARLLLGQTYLRLGDGASAEKELRRAKEFGLERQEWLIPLGRVYLLQGQNRRVLEEIKADPDDPAEIQSDILVLQGFAELALGETDSARKKLAEALALSPGNVDAMIGLARLALLDQDLEKALGLVDQVLVKNPDHVQAWLIKGEAERLRGDQSEAITAFGKVLALQPNHTLARIARAESYLAQQALDEALSDAEAVLKVQPDAPPAHYLRGRILFRKQELPAAREALQRVLRFTPGHLPSQLLLGAIDYTQGQLNQAKEYLTRVVAAEPDHLPARKLLAATELGLGNPRQAAETLQPALAQAPQDAQLLAMLGSAYLQDRDYVKAAEYLQKAAEIAPEASAIRTQLALSQLGAGQFDRAVTELQSAIDLGQGVFQADVLLTLAHLQQKDYAKAAAAASTLVEKLPDNPVPRNLLGIAYVAQGERERAREQFERALALEPGFSTAAVNLARLDLLAGDRQAAAARYQEILQHEEGQLDALLGLAALAEQAGNAEEALRRLEQSWEKNPTSTKAGLALSQQYMERGENLKALQIVRSLHAADPDDPLVLRALGLVQLANGETASALANFRKLTQRWPQSAEAWHFVAAAQLKAEDYKAAGEALDQALALREDYLPSLVARTRLQLHRDHLEEALDTVLEIQARHPAEAIGYKLEGDVHRQRQAFAEAASAYRTAQEKSPASQHALLLADAQRLADDPDAAVETLRVWLADNPEDFPVRMQRAMYLQQMDRQIEAIKEYERLAESQPDNVIVLNNLAWLYNEAGDPRAVHYAERAGELAPERPEVADTVGWILVQNNRTQQGLVWLQQAAMRAPQIPDIRYHLAVAYAKAGRRDEARRELQQLVKDHPDFAEIRQARALLEEER